MQSLLKAKSVPEKRPPGLILQSKKPIKFYNNYNNLMNRMDKALSEIHLDDNEIKYRKKFRTYQYNDNIIVVSNRTETLN